MTSLAAYFSHSWNARDIHINVKIWEHLVAAGCHLLIDRAEEDRGGKPPYFISRIETLLRRSDVFVGCLPTLPADRWGPRQPAAFGDWKYSQCSPFILFELRLAERADLPRFFLYDLESRFRPPDYIPPHVRYVPRRFDELREKLSGGGEDQQLAEELEQWLNWVRKHHRPVRPLESSRAAYCLDESAHGNGVRELVEQAVDDGGFERPKDLRSLFQTDAELHQVLRSLAVLVVDLGRQDLLPLYHVAHSLLVPTIRVHSQLTATEDGRDDALPPLLRGHPGGYQRDLVLPTTDSAFDDVMHRSRAIIRSTKPIIGYENGRALLYERTYPRHLVFISHDEKPPDRLLVDEIVKRCRSQGIACWEYALENRSGEFWRHNMHAALEKTTHMVALLSEAYEQSPGCTEELDFALARRPQVKVFPYLTRGRSKPVVALREDEISHEPLWGQRSPGDNADVVVAQVRDTLWHSLSR